MKKQSQKIIGMTLSTLALFVLSSCEKWHNDCINGQIIVENPIPDTTLYVGNTFVRDPFMKPVVFSHSASEDINIGLNGDLQIVRPDLLRSEITGELDVIELTAKSEGATLIEVIATDNCEGRTVVTTFNVTVIDSTNN